MDDCRLKELFDRFPSQRIAVIGDYFLDKYLETDPALIEQSVETGLPANQVVSVRCHAGAAGTVVNNLAALGVESLFAIGAIGHDGEAFDLCKSLNDIGCLTDHLQQFDAMMTPTYLKPRDVTNSGLSGEFERYDTKNRQCLPDAISQGVLKALDACLENVDAVIVCDQVSKDGCGVISKTVRQHLSRRATEFKSVVFWADSRTRIRQFPNLMIKPNQFEMIERLNPSPGEQVDIDELTTCLPALRLQNRAPVVVTLGERGMLISDPEPMHIPTVELVGPLDPTGAGDSASAGVVAALAANATLGEAALIGNLVASITVQQLATTGTASPMQIVDRLQLWRHQQATSDRKNPSTDA